MKKVVLPFAAVLLLLAFGCSEQKGTAPDTTGDNAGGTAVDVQKLVDENTNSDWSQPEAAPAFQGQLDSIDTSYDMYAVVFIWGHFAPPNDTIVEPTDWSGSLSMNAVGNLKVKHLIRFEPGQDTLYPQTDSGAISWGSVTTRNVDGLGLVVLVKRGIEYFAPPTLSFQTAPFSIEIPVDGLARLNAFYRVDNHNGIVIFARQIPRRHCPKGAIMGIWHRDTSWNNGPFEALWIKGDVITAIWPPDPRAIFAKAHGRFFMTEDGQRLFHGRYADSTGTEVGNLFGTWEYDDPTMCPQCGQGHAVFRGKFTRDPVGDGPEIEVGEIHGQLGLGPGPTFPRMDLPMHGRWRVKCGDSTTTSPDRIL